MKTLCLITTLGVPGSGKTYFSERLAKKLDLFHLNSDRLRLELYHSPQYTKNENQSFFRTMDFLAEELLRRRVSVIYDANTTLHIFRQRLRKLAKPHGAKFILLVVETPLPIASRRLGYRRQLRQQKKLKYYRPIKDEILRRINQEIESPHNEPHITLDGTKPFAHEWSKISRAMRVKF